MYVLHGKHKFLLKLFDQLMNDLQAMCSICWNLMQQNIWHIAFVNSEYKEKLIFLGVGILKVFSHYSFGCWHANDFF